MENIRRICHAMVDLSKFTSNKNILSKIVAITNFVVKLCHLSKFTFNKKKILSEVVALEYNQVYNQNLSIYFLIKVFLE